MKRPGLFGLSLALAWQGCAVAAEVRSVEVSRKHGVYYIESETFVEAPLEVVFELMLDYEAFTKLTSTFKESGYLERNEDGSGIVYTRAEGCILFICRTVRRVERLESVPYEQIETTVIPEQSNLKSGSSEWRFFAENGGTRLLYRADMEPAFWIPPLIGPPMIKYWLRKGGEGSVHRVEALALERARARETAQR